MVLAEIYILIIVISLIILIQLPRPFGYIDNPIENEPLVSIIIPARNESKNIERCLHSLTNQSYKNTEIIVVDGNSEDDTRELVENFPRVKLIKEPDRPANWIGKPWACYQGYLVSSGEILLFTDADTYHTSDSLVSGLEQLEGNDTIGFVTVLTSQEFKSFWEHMLTLIFVIIGIATNGSKGTDRTTIANGQYILFKKSMYEKLGTHQIVAESIIEDLELGTKAAKAGFPPLLIAKQGLIYTRMYRSFSDILEGFGKNLALGMGIIRLRDFAKVAFIQLWGMFFVIAWLIEYFIFGSISQSLFVISLIAYVSHFLFLTFSEWWLTTSFTLYMLLYPLYYFAMWFVIFYSVTSTYLSREIVWKGITYDVK